MEQRGSGLGRMKAAMLDHGLDVPEFDSVDGYFQLTLRGPAEDLERLQIPPEAAKGGIPPSIADRLNERQCAILERIAREGNVTSGWCRNTFGVSYDTANRDLIELIGMGLVVRVGKGRSTRYVLKSGDRSDA